MLLSLRDVVLFFRLEHALMFYVNQRLQMFSDVDTPDDFGFYPPEKRAEILDAVPQHLELIESFVQENPLGLTGEELEIIGSWRHLVHGKFLVLRQLKKYAIFLSMSDPSVAYGVVALAEPFEQIIPLRLPYMAETSLLPFKGMIVYDGILRGDNVSFGAGIRRHFNESYQEAKARQGIVPSLPAAAAPPKQQPAPKKTRRKATAAKPGKTKDVQPVLETVVGLTDQFCREYLNDEYAALCRKLAEKLARKRPSPLLSGKPDTWASGIVQTIGWANFLDDKTTQPHMTVADIAAGFGVGESTSHAKSKTIRTAFKIVPFDPEWTLPSRLEDNPLVWMLEVNGFIMDIRQAPRELQEAAFSQGLIPYIPADHAGK